MRKGTKFPVKLSIGDAIKITDRWEEFSRHYGVELGDILNFKFNLKDTFYVHIYDKFKMEVDYT